MARIKATLTPFDVNLVKTEMRTLAVKLAVHVSDSGIKHLIWYPLENIFDLRSCSTTGMAETNWSDVARFKTLKRAINAYNRLVV